jgi:membrane protein DedA with SNARE-associated domain
MESTGIPMPGETILISAAALAGTKHALEIQWVIAAAAGGAIVGDNIGFWVGREFGEPLLERWGHLVGLDARKRMLGRYLFAPYGGSIVFFGPFVALLRAFAAALAGANALAPWRFFLFNALGGIVRATVFGLGGYLLGASIHRVAGPVGWTMLILALAAVLVLWRYFKHHEERLLAKAELEKEVRPTLIKARQPGASGATATVAPFDEIALREGRADATERQLSWRFRPLRHAAIGQLLPWLSRVARS